MHFLTIHSDNLPSASRYENDVTVLLTF